MMTILTGIVLTIALGAVAQRGDVFQNMGAGPGLEPRDDVVSLAPDGAYLIDLVANDRGALSDDGGRILIMSGPACGTAYRRDGRLFYEGAAACEGSQRLSYCVARGDDCLGAEVTLMVSALTVAPGSASGTPVEALSELEAEIAAASVSEAPLSSAFIAEPLLLRNDGPLAGIASAFGSLAPERRPEDDPLKLR